MRRGKLIALYLLILSVLTLGAAEKIALSAYGGNACRLSELFFARYSDQYEFVERALFSEIEQERFLQQKFGMEKRSRRARLTGASIFLAFQDLPDGKMQVAMFETNYGFRLKTIFPAQENPAQLKDELDQALKNIQNPEGLRFFSFAGVRNNLHYSLLNQAQTVHAELTARTYSSSLIFLERDYLIELLLEQELTGKWANAVFASEVLHFELNPGDKAENFVISAYLTDAEEKITFRQTAERSADVPLLFDALEAYVAAPRPAKSYAAQKEAARFAREAELARIHHAPEHAVKFYFAAFTLDQSNAKYLSAMGHNSDRQKFSEVYPYYRAALEYLTRHENLLNHHETYSGALFICHIIRRKRAELTSAEQQDYWRFLARHREKFLNAVQFDPIESFALDQSLNCFSQISPELYPSTREYQIAMADVWQDILAALKTGKPVAMSDEHWRHLLHDTIYDHTAQLFRLQSVLPRKQLAGWTRDVCRALDDSGMKALRPLSLILEINALLYSAEYSESKLLALFQEYCDVSREQKAGEPANCVFYDPQKVAQYPGLAAKLRRNRTDFQQPTRPATETNKILSCYRDDSEENLYFLTDDDFDFKVMKRDRMNCETVLATFPKSYQDRMTLRESGLWGIHSDGRHIAVTDSDKVYIGASGIMRELRKFPFPIRFAVVCDDRVYLAGDREFLSCNLQGEDRQILFSASQTEKMLDIQKHHPDLKIQALFAVKADQSCYIELANSQYREVIQFDAKSGKIIRNSTFSMPKKME